MPLSQTFALKNFILRERDSSKPRKLHQSMASSMIKSLIRGASSPSISPASSQLKSIICSSSRSYAKASAKEIKEKQKEIEKEKEKPREERVITSEVEAEDSDVPTSGISRPLSEILRELNKRVPDALIRVRNEDGFSAKYVPWHVVNRIMNIHAPEWSGEIRSITYSADGKSVSVVYRVTLYGTDAEIYRESSGTASLDDTSYGDPVQKAEAMAFRRACARLGLGLHLYHEDML